MNKIVSKYFTRIKRKKKIKNINEDSKDTDINEDTDDADLHSMRWVFYLLFRGIFMIGCQISGVIKHAFH